MKAKKSRGKARSAATSKPKDLTAKGAGAVRGGDTKTARSMDMLSKLIQAKNDMQKGIIANFRV
jgi:hypothetical protein